MTQFSNDCKTIPEEIKKKSVENRQNDEFDNGMEVDDFHNLFHDCSHHCHHSDDFLQNLFGFLKICFSTIPNICRMVDS